MSGEKAYKKSPAVSVGSDVGLGVCVEIAAQCYGYVACSEMARKDKAVLELAEDLHASREMEKLLASEKLIADLQSGERVILPKTKAHAQAMLRVAFAVLESLESSSPNAADDRRAPKK